MIYTVKNVKSFQGREGNGYECSLYKDGKKIGTVTDTASGGMTDFYLDKGEKEILDAHCLTLPKWGSEFGDGEDKYDTDCDIFIGNIVSEFEQTRDMKRKCNKKTLFTLHTDKKKGMFWSMNSLYTPKIKAYLEDKYGKKLKEIINERFV